MKRLTAVMLFLSAFLFTNLQVEAVTVADYSTVMKTVKKMEKLSKKGDIQKLSSYYSDDYKSFDGYGKKELIQIFEISGQLYPNAKSKEKITRTEVVNDFIKVYIEETLQANLDVKGIEAQYAVDNKIKGRMNSFVQYVLIFKKENDGIWRVFGDEIHNERTDIKYGEAIEIPFAIETPKTIKSGNEFSVKTTIQMPEDKIAVGAIGHDVIVFPPVKYPAPFRAIDDTGILERVMIANKDGMNEYVNATYAFIAPVKTFRKKNKTVTKKAGISGMGLVVKRINSDKETAR